jgi:hypothetical protein
VRAAVGACAQWLLGALISRQALLPYEVPPPPPPHPPTPARPCSGPHPCSPPRPRSCLHLNKGRWTGHRSAQLNSHLTRLAHATHKPNPDWAHPRRPMHGGYLGSPPGTSAPGPGGFWCSPARPKVHSSDRSATDPRGPDDQLSWILDVIGECGGPSGGAGGGVCACVRASVRPCVHVCVRECA